jgi:hypothetical protein
MENPGQISVEIDILATSPQNAFEFDMPGAPEASTWVMLVAGFAGLGFAGYRKTRSGQRVAVAV